MDSKSAAMAPQAEHPERFSPTRWSLVAVVQGGEPLHRAAALLELCQHYAYPVYSYIRHCGHGPTAAAEMARAFLDRLAGAELPNCPVDAPGRFRDFLLAALHQFLATEGQLPERKGLPPVLRPGVLEAMEARHQVHAAKAGSPEQAYQRGFALALISCAMDRLRLEASQAGRSELFEALESSLSGDVVPGHFEELAASLKLRPLGVVMAAKRLRQRFRELVEAELADTVGDRDAVDAERDALRRTLL